MGHYAQIDSNNIVTRVIVAKAEFINSGALPGKWIKTSYNTRNGIHELGGVPLRKNFAAIGYIYHPDLDIFTPPKPVDSYVLDIETGQWVPPNGPLNTRGSDTQYRWDEATRTYIGFEKPPIE
jgi:hypothetical protein